MVQRQAQVQDHVLFKQGSHSLHLSSVRGCHCHLNVHLVLLSLNSQRSQSEKSVFSDQTER